MNLQKYLTNRKNYLDAALDRILVKGSEYPDKLYEAVRYSVFAGGKRIRPVLMMAACEAVGGRKNDVLYPACAVEMIHTYSLIHDDLPAMDDDDFRRGKPTCHRAYGEAMAVLAGDSLLTEAFFILTRPEFIRKKDPLSILGIIREISMAAGYKGMIAGQAIDMELQGKDVDFARLEYLHIHKTGALILACIKIGAMLGGATPRELKKLVKYGECIGLAFQIADDILDVEGERRLTGKEIGMDKKLGKVTYPGVVGLKEAKSIAGGLIASAENSISSFGKKADPLREIARYIIERKK